MENENIYPELLDYIYDYQANFMTKDERLADNMHRYNPDTIPPWLLEIKRKTGQYSDDERIKNMLSDGFDVFRRRVAERIYNEHRKELQLNLCPKCHKIARTPLAKQCRICFHNWH